MIRLTGPPARERYESVNAQARFAEGISQGNTPVSTPMCIGTPRASTPTSAPPYGPGTAVSIRPKGRRTAGLICSCQMDVQLRLMPR